MYHGFGSVVAIFNQSRVLPEDSFAVISYLITTKMIVSKIGEHGTVLKHWGKVGTVILILKSE